MKGQKLMQPIVVTYRRHGRNFWALYPKLYWQIFFYWNHLQNIKCFDACQSNISKTATKSMFLFQYIDQGGCDAFCCFFLATFIAIMSIAATATIAPQSVCPDTKKQSLQHISLQQSCIYAQGCKTSVQGSFEYFAQSIHSYSYLV